MHPEADYPWLELASLAPTRTRYVDQLVSTYGFEAPLEGALQLTPQLGDFIQLRYQARSGLIVEDLLSLGLTASRIARLPQCLDVAPFRDPAEGFGWIYVIERATLLYESVRAHLMLRLPYVTAWRYLSTYDTDARMHWLQLGRAFDDFAVTSERVEQIIEAARTAFACQRMWRNTEPARRARTTWSGTAELTALREE